MDRIGGTAGTWGLPRAFLVCSGFALPGTLLGIVCVQTSSATIAFSLAAVAVFCMCATLAPVNGILLKTVPSDLRPFGMSLNLFMIHLLGDFPSPIVVGWIADALAPVRGCGPFCGLEAAVTMMMAWCCFAFAFWVIGFAISYGDVKRLGSDASKDDETEVIASDDAAESDATIQGKPL